MSEQAETEQATAEKVDFASAAWVNAARAVLEELVANHAEEDAKLSVCEVFTGAPPRVAASGTAAWHFAIDGKRVTVGQGELADADIVIRADYDAALPGARTVYTPEFLAQRESMPPAEIPPDIKGDLSALPPWLVELHNRLAVVTA